jgi:polyhydroxyalkanoate synthesis regulator phasin
MNSKTNAILLAAALCVPSALYAQAPDQEGPQAPDGSDFVIAALFEDESAPQGPAPEFQSEFAPDGGNGQQFAEGPGQRRGMRQGRGADDDQGGCPMMGGKRDGAGRGQGMMNGQRGFGHQGFGKGGPDMKQAMDVAFATVDPEKFAELQKLREQEMKLVKELSEKAKTQREEFKKLVDDYRANPSDELKAKIREKVAAREDAVLKLKEAKLAEMTKKLDEAKSSKNSAVDQLLEKALSKPQPKGFDGKPAPCPKGDGSCPMKPGDKQGPPPPRANS